MYSTVSKILVIDDEPDLVNLLKECFESNGHFVLSAYDGNTGIKKLEEHPDIIILDIMMPGMSGFEVCKNIRKYVSCPIIFLSSKQSEVDKIKGLSLGADDYIIKPFSIKELRARIEAHLRREKRAVFINSTKKDRLLYFKNLIVNLKSREVYITNIKINLTRKEFDIIELLALHAGQIFSKEQLYENICGFEGEGDSSTITEHIKNIRAKFFAVDSINKYISTVWGIGYKWENLY